MSTRHWRWDILILILEGTYVQDESSWTHGVCFCTLLTKACRHELWHFSLVLWIVSQAPPIRSSKNLTSAFLWAQLSPAFGSCFSRAPRLSEQLQFIVHLNVCRIWDADLPTPHYDWFLSGVYHLRAQPFGSLVPSLSPTDTCLWPSALSSPAESQYQQDAEGKWRRVDLTTCSSLLSQIQPASTFRNSLDHSSILFLSVFPRISKCDISYFTSAWIRTIQINILVHEISLELFYVLLWPSCKFPFLLFLFLYILLRSFFFFWMACHFW